MTTEKSSFGGGNDKVLSRGPSAESVVPPTQARKDVDTDDWRTPVLAFGPEIGGRTALLTLGRKLRRHHDL